MIKANLQVYFPVTDRTHDNTPPKLSLILWSICFMIYWYFRLETNACSGFIMRYNALNDPTGVTGHPAVCVSAISPPCYRASEPAAPLWSWHLVIAKPCAPTMSAHQVHFKRESPGLTLPQSDVGNFLKFIAWFEWVWGWRDKEVVFRYH